MSESAALTQAAIDALMAGPASTNELVQDSKPEPEQGPPTPNPVLTTSTPEPAPARTVAPAAAARGPAPLRSKLISTGNTELDKKMGGGIPEGSLMLIEGQSGAGKSILTQQLVWGALNSGRRVAYYATENTPASLLRQMTSLHMDITDFFLLGRINIYSVRSAPEGDEARSMLQSALRHMMKSKDRDVIAFDSLSMFITNIAEKDTVTFFTAAKELCDENKTVLLTMHSYAFSETMFIRLRSIADAYLRLRVGEARGQLMKEMEVAKIRGAEQGTGNIIAFDVEPGMGMRVIPMTRAKA